jgi:hypothetical protein
MTATAQKPLDDALIKQLTFKPSIMRDIAIVIVQAMLAAPDYKLWADELDMSFVQEKKDKNCIGGAWRQLRQVGILSRSTEFRRSVYKPSKGRTVFMWRLQSLKLAETFLARNGHPAAKRQAELAL